MKIKEIAEGCGIIGTRGSLEKEISSVTSDSRQAEAGTMFVAVNGFSSDGHSYIPAAVAKGAAAIVYDDEAALEAAFAAAGETADRREDSRNLHRTRFNWENAAACWRRTSPGSPSSCAPISALPTNTCSPS